MDARRKLPADVNELRYLDGFEPKYGLTRAEIGKMYDTSRQAVQARLGRAQDAEAQPRARGKFPFSPVKKEHCAGWVYDALLAYVVATGKVRRALTPRERGTLRGFVTEISNWGGQWAVLYDRCSELGFYFQDLQSAIQSGEPIMPIEILDEFL